MKTPEKAINEAIENIGIKGQEADDLRKKVTKLTSDIYEKGMSPYEAMGLSKEMMESFYSFGYRMYNTGQYDQATQLFRLLILLDPTNPKYLFGLAACFHMEKDFENAASTYIVCSLIDLNDPIPHYHASDCYINLKKYNLAIDALNVSLQRMENRAEFSAIRDRAQVTLDMLNDKIGKKEKEESKKEQAA